MPLVRRLLLFLAACAVAGPALAAEDLEPLFAAAGFGPLSGQREVRRALFQDTFITLKVQGLEFERHADGRVTMTLVGPGLKPEPLPMPAATWSQLLAAEGGVFERALPLPGCPAWALRLAASGREGRRFASVSGCVMGDPGLAYAAELTRIAVSTRPDCVYDPGNPFWTFPDCFE